MNMLFYLYFAVAAKAGEGPDHTHSIGGELEHMWPIITVLGVLLLAGVIFNLTSKRKR